MSGERVQRRILCVFPRYAPSFGSFEFSYKLTDGISAFMPPQGLLVIAAALPKSWPVRFIDENLEAATPEDFAWADAVFVSGMHVQRRQMDDIRGRAQAAGKPAMLGGSSVSACPEHYPEFDYLHVGELGDATEELIARLERDPSRPPQQVVLTTRERRELTDFPLPAYELAQLKRYFIGSIQFSSGCPYQCEFCDIPALYGRNPRFKTAEQVCAELDKMRACGLVGAVYFVDDNFIAHRRAVRELLPHLIDWQKRNNYPYTLACEATLNIAKRPEILELMREQSVETEPSQCDVYVVHSGEETLAAALHTAERLRDAGIDVLMHAGGGSFKSQFRRADASGAQFAVILGPDELARGEAGLKWLRDDGAETGSGRQQSVSLETLADSVIDALLQDGDEDFEMDDDSAPRDGPDQRRIH